MAESDLEMAIAMNNADADRAARSVYVVIALDGDARVRECFVMTDYEEASHVFKNLKPIWGGANVALASRRIDAMPVFTQDVIEIQQEQ